MKEALRIALLFTDGAILAYLLVFVGLNLSFAVVAFANVRRFLQGEQVRPAASREKDAFLPTITLLVPAYNEEVTIVESLRSLLRLRYPSFEIVICNDGSKDRTVDVLRRAFSLVRTELEYHAHLGTAPIRAFYTTRGELPPGVRRIVLIDKENGGKADALNAAINLAQGDFVVSMDADSLLEPDALLRAAQPIAEDPRSVVAVGTQVGLSNGAEVTDGRVVEVRVPRSWIARFQVVEYMRSFVQSRTALSTLGSLLVLSGVFALLRRDLVVAIGGFLSKHMQARVGIEYCGEGAHTVCEDMEIIVRFHRYLLDKGISGRIVLIPPPAAWTEAPENARDLGKQRARWYRGLLEVLVFHRAMLFRRRFGRVGLFALPYQVFFEALAPILECVGYAVLAVTLAAGLFSLRSALLFLGLALAAHFCLTTLAIVMCTFTERGPQSRLQGLSLSRYARLRDIVRLSGFGLLSCFGYRQFLVAWQLRGLWDYMKGKKGWDKFARKGFAPEAAR